MYLLKIFCVQIQHKMSHFSSIGVTGLMLQHELGHSEDYGLCLMQ